MRTILLFTFILLTTQLRGIYADTLYYDTIQFEVPYAYLEIDTSAQCIWQIARPQKLFFNSSYSGEKAILTDSVSSYPTDNLSFFELKIGEFNCSTYVEVGLEEIVGFCIEFKHKFDTDTLADGG